MNITKTTAMTAELTPTQVRGLKLAKDGDLYPRDAKTWTHLNATITFARSDRFKERPIKVKSVTTATVDQLRELGLLCSLDTEDSPTGFAHQITMAGKMWLLKHK